MRLPYAPAEPPAPGDTPDAESTAAIYARIAARRAPRPLIALDRALLIAPPVADGWSSFLGAVRERTTLGAGPMELAICRVAVLNGAAYVWKAHAPLARQHGVERAALEALREMEEIQGDAEKEDKTGRLSAVQLAVVAYADAMTRTIRVSDARFERLKEFFEERQIVELTATIAAYNCTSRFLIALDVGEMNGKEMEMPEEIE